jgi:hypothetical protein
MRCGKKQAIEKALGQGSVKTVWSKEDKYLLQAALLEGASM